MQTLHENCGTHFTIIVIYKNDILSLLITLKNIYNISVTHTHTHPPTYDGMGWSDGSTDLSSLQAPVHICDEGGAGSDVRVPPGTGQVGGADAAAPGGSRALDPGGVRTLPHEDHQLGGQSQSRLCRHQQLGSQSWPGLERTHVEHQRRSSWRKRSAALPAFIPPPPHPRPFCTPLLSSFLSDVLWREKWCKWHICALT